MMIKFTWISWFNLVVDTCFHYKHLNETNRKNNYKTPLKFVLCDKQLQEGWYRFVGAAGTKMPTTRVPAFRCGTNWSGWLNGAHPTVEDGMVAKEVCFSDRDTGCKYWTTIHVKNCEFYFIYKLRSTACHSRYCGTDWTWSAWLHAKTCLINLSAGT